VVKEVMVNRTRTPGKVDYGGLYALVCLLLVGSCLALSLVVAKLADGAGAPRLTFLMMAVAGAGMVFAVVGALQRRSMRLNRRTLEHAVVAGVLFALHNALAFLALRNVGAAFISLSFAYPILVTWLLAVCLGLERLSVMR